MGMGNASRSRPPCEYASLGNGSGEPNSDGRQAPRASVPGRFRHCGVLLCSALCLDAAGRGLLHLRSAAQVRVFGSGLLVVAPGYFDRLGVMTILYIVGVLAMYVFIRRRPAQWIAMAIGIYALLRAPYAVVVPTWIESLTNDFGLLPDGFHM